MFVIFAALLVAGPAEQAAAAPNDAYNTKKVCKSVAVTGSRLGGKRECRTQAQWDYNSRFAQDDAKDITDKPGYGPGSN